MAETDATPMGWGTIIAIMLATGFITGFTLAGLREGLGIDVGSAGIGASVGVVGALLITRRAAALRGQQKQP